MTPEQAFEHVKALWPNIKQITKCDNSCTFYDDAIERLIHAKIEWPENMKVYPAPRPTIAVDTPVWVRHTETASWNARHFYRWNENGKIECFDDGRTSHTAKCFHDGISYWNYYSLTEPDRGIDWTIPPKGSESWGKPTS